MHSNAITYFSNDACIAGSEQGTASIHAEGLYAWMVAGSPSHVYIWSPEPTKTVSVERGMFVLCSIVCSKQASACHEVVLPQNVPGSTHVRVFSLETDAAPAMLAATAGCAHMLSSHCGSDMGQMDGCSIGPASPRTSISACRSYLTAPPTRSLPWPAAWSE